jgi:hypothetical protein
MKLLSHFAKWMAAVLSTWYGWVGASATAGLVGFGQGLGWWGSPGKRTYIGLLIIGFVISVFGAWRKQYIIAEQEKAKNEIAPDIEVQISSVITKGRLGDGVTDLFIHAILLEGTK